MTKPTDLLIKISDGNGDFTTIAGLRSRLIGFNGEVVPVHKPDEVAHWLSLLTAKATIARASFAGRGLFKDASSDALMRQNFFDGSIRDYKIVIPSFGAVQGPFQITALEFAGEHNGEVTYDVAMESAGAMGFAAA